MSHLILFVFFYLLLGLARIMYLIIYEISLKLKSDNKIIRIFPTSCTQAQSGSERRRDHRDVRELARDGEHSATKSTDAVAKTVRPNWAHDQNNKSTSTVDTHLYCFTAGRESFSSAVAEDTLCMHARLGWWKQGILHVLLETCRFPRSTPPPVRRESQR